MKPHEMRKAAMAAIIKRVFALRMTDAEFCQRADIAPSNYSRAKTSGASVTTIRKLEDTLTAIEAERAS